MNNKTKRFFIETLINKINLIDSYLFKYSSKKHGKKEASQKVAEPSAPPSMNHQLSGLSNFSIKDLQMAMDVLNLQHKPAKTQEEALQKPYQFWSTQPVPKMSG